MKNIFFLLITCLILFSACLRKKDPLDRYEIKEIANIGFRKTYVGIMNQIDSLTEQESDSLMKVEPITLMNDEDKDKEIFKKFTSIGLIKNNELQLDKFKGITTNTFILSNNLGDTLHGKIINDMKHTPYMLIKSNHHKKRIDFSEDCWMSNVPDVSIFDLYKSGFEEIIILENYYIMNGDNYNLRIFRIE